jgi:hypothetical protein
LESAVGLSVKLLAALTVSVYARLPVNPEYWLSVAVIVKFDVPVVVGVPLNKPVVELNPSHEGRLPLVTAKVYVPEPPLAVIVTL